MKYFGRGRHGTGEGLFPSVGLPDGRSRRGPLWDSIEIKDDELSGGIPKGKSFACGLESLPIGPNSLFI